MRELKIAVGDSNHAVKWINKTMSGNHHPHQ